MRASVNGRLLAKDLAGRADLSTVNRPDRSGVSGNCQSRTSMRPL